MGILQRIPLVNPLEIPGAFIYHPELGSEARQAYYKWYGDHGKPLILLRGHIGHMETHLETCPGFRGLTLARINYNLPEDCELAAIRVEPLLSLPAPGEMQSACQCHEDCIE